MGSIYRRSDSPFWWCSFADASGRRILKSTGSLNHRTAREVLSVAEIGAALARRGRMTTERARTILESIMPADAPSVAITVRDYLKGWIAARSGTVAPSTLEQYKNTAKVFCDVLGPSADRSIPALTLADVLTFRSQQERTGTLSSFNKHLRILRSAWGRAVKDGLLTDNLMKRVDTFKVRRQERRGLTVAEVQSVLEVAGHEWRGLILFGLFTGQRLGDVASLRWSNLDADMSEVRLTSRKTGRRVVVPLAVPVRDWLTGCPTPAASTAPIFARASTVRTSRLSRDFVMLLESVGLRERKSHSTKAQGRRGTRQLGELSFHCLRHSFVSLLKSAGVSPAVAMELAGHETAAVSRAYTHFDPSELRGAIDKLPGVVCAAFAISKQQTKKETDHDHENERTTHAVLEADMQPRP